MKTRFLLVDDSRTVRVVMKRTLEMAGYDTSAVMEAGNGREALEVLAKNTFDVLLTDIHMPIMDGVELVQRVRSDARNAAMPIIVVSSESTEERRQQMLALGAAHVLAKPFTAERVKSVLEAVGAALPR